MAVMNSLKGKCFPIWWAVVYCLCCLCGLTIILADNIDPLKILNVSWGEILVPRGSGPAEIGIHCDRHYEVFKFPHGTNGLYIQSIFRSRMCALIDQANVDEALDDIFSQWYSKIFYFPGLYVHNMDTTDNEYRLDMLASRSTILAMLADKYQYKRYLEIGTDKNEVFSAASPRFEVAVGVDPANGGTVRMTSDKFFLQNDQYFDLIFVDGLHEAHQVYRDILNALRWLNPGGTVVMHDCSPHGDLDERANAIFKKGAWNGNVWKAVVALRLLDYIEVVVVDIDHGVGVIRKRPNHHPLSAEWIDKLGYIPIDVLTNEHLNEARRELLRLVSWNGLQRWLDEEEESPAI
jgi:predicted O-methyltransferase YrrM